jgi:hypothetical protein
VQDRIRIELNEEPQPWREGLTAFASRGVLAHITVEGVPETLEGHLVELGDDFVVIETGPSETSGEATWIRRDRILTVTASYEYFDRYLIVKEGVEQDPTIIERVREALDEFRRQGHHPAPTRDGRYPTFVDIAATIDDISALQVEAALDLLGDDRDRRR